MTSAPAIRAWRYLQRFPIDKVKIDIAFVRNITGRISEATIAQTIIQMAHSLKMKAIAEGVETAEQHAYLRHHGCDEFQGYFFSHPLPVEEIAALFRGDALCASATRRMIDVIALDCPEVGQIVPAPDDVATVH